MADVDPRDERRHRHDDTELWNESYYFDWFTEDLSLGGYVRIGFYPNLGRVWYWACLVGPDRPLVTVIEHDVPMPRSETSLELRHDGLWADHVVEEPNEHMSINLEAFAVSLDDPAETYRDLRGERVPFGFELDFFTDGGTYQWPPITPRYEIPCRVHGEVLVGDERIPFDGWGQRDHSWGAARDWWAMSWNWTAGRLDDGTRWHSAGGFFPDNPWGVAYRQDPGAAMEEFDEVVVEVVEGPERLPQSSSTRFDDLELTYEPLAHSPVLLVHPDGREARFPRTLARVTASDGRTGGGWFEWNQPPAAGA